VSIGGRGNISGRRRTFSFVWLRALGSKRDVPVFIRPQGLCRIHRDAGRGQIKAEIIRVDSQSNVPIQARVATRPMPTSAGGQRFASIAFSDAALADTIEEESHRSVGWNAMVIAVAP
jgi:hypothetical protein